MSREVIHKALLVCRLGYEIETRLLKTLLILVLCHCVKKNINFTIIHVILYYTSVIYITVHMVKISHGAYYGVRMPSQPLTPT